MCFTGSVKQISFIVSARVSVAGYLHSIMCFTGNVKSVLSFQLVSVLLATYIVSCALLVALNQFYRFSSCQYCWLPT